MHRTVTESGDLCKAAHKNCFKASIAWLCPNGLAAYKDRQSHKTIKLSSYTIRLLWHHVKLYIA